LRTKYKNIIAANARLLVILITYCVMSGIAVAKEVRGAANGTERSVLGVNGFSSHCRYPKREVERCGEDRMDYTMKMRHFSFTVLYWLSISPGS